MSILTSQMRHEERFRKISPGVQRDKSVSKSRLILEFIVSLMVKLATFESSAIKSRERTRHLEKLQSN